MAKKVFFPLWGAFFLASFVLGSALYPLLNALAEPAIYWAWLFLSSALFSALLAFFGDYLEGRRIEREKALFEKNAIMKDLGFPLPEGKDPDALLGYYQEVLSALSEKKREIDLAKNENAFLLSHMRQGYLLFDKDGVIVRENPLAREFLLSSGGSLYGKSYKELSLSEEATKKLEEGFAGKIESFDVAIKDKTYLFMPAKGVLNGELFYALFALDVTENRLTAKLRKEFFQNASHELKGPLTSILGYEELLASGLLPAEEKENAQKSVLRAAKRMKAIVDGMLTLFAIESRLPQKKTEVRLKPLFESLIEEERGALEKGNLTLESSLEDVSIEGYPKDLSLIFENLLSNAIKYNNPGGAIKVELTAKGFSVSDTGIGIKESDLPRIFERFYVADRSRSPENNATGLGLAIVKHLCLNDGYSIHVSSKYGRGSRFEVSFRKEPVESEAQ